jgi:hypothetical protein
MWLLKQVYGTQYQAPYAGTAQLKRVTITERGKQDEQF